MRVQSVMWDTHNVGNGRRAMKWENMTPHSLSLAFMRNGKFINIIYDGHKK